jgi:hypothetical protein
MTTSLPDFKAIEAHDNKVAAKAAVWARYGKLVLYFIMFAVAWGGWPSITQQYFDRLTWVPLCSVVGQLWHTGAVARISAAGR